MKYMTFNEYMEEAKVGDKIAIKATKTLTFHVRVSEVRKKNPYASFRGNYACFIDGEFDGKMGRGFFASEHYKIRRIQHCYA